MTIVNPELGFYALAGQPKSPRDLIEELQQGEAMGLGTAFLSERYNSKEICTLSGAAGAVTDRIRIATAATNHNTRHPIVTAGYAVLRKTLGDIWGNYPMVFRFLCGQMLLQAAVSAVIGLATVYMVSFMGMSTGMVAAVFGLAMVGIPPGAALASTLAKRMDIQKVVIATCLLWTASFVVAPWVLGPDESGGRTVALLLFAVLWGLCFGMTFTATKAMYTTIIPGGREAEPVTQTSAEHLLDCNESAVLHSSMA